jgi:peptidoglycan hydrolase-like protein with peptidoglycan-binding domain
MSFEFETSQPTVRWGSQGPAVKTLQAQLKKLGFEPGPIDGIFGSDTDSAVRAFQRARGIQVDGIVGPQTWATLYVPVTPSRPTPSSPPATGAGGRAIHLSVPFYGFQSNDRDGCFRRCTEMAAAVNVRIGGPDVRIQVATREDTLGRVTIDPGKAREGIAYTDAQLGAGHPVVMGVSYTDHRPLRDRDLARHRSTARSLLRIPRSGHGICVQRQRPEPGQPILFHSGGRSLPARERVGAARQHALRRGNDTPQPLTYLLVAAACDPAAVRVTSPAPLAKISRPA